MSTHIKYQLEEKMGGGTWSRVYQTKEEADYESPLYVSFDTQEQVINYANTSGRWRNPIDRGVVRIVKVTTTRELI